jgi:hypothetical protein
MATPPQRTAAHTPKELFLTQNNTNQYPSKHQQQYNTSPANNAINYNI